MFDFTTNYFSLSTSTTPDLKRIVVDSNKTVHVIYKITGTAELKYFNIDKDNNISAVETIAAYTLTSGVAHSIACDSNNNVYVAWGDRISSTTQIDIKYRKRNSNGVWDSEVTIISESIYYAAQTYKYAHIFGPYICIDVNDNFIITWIRSRQYDLQTIVKWYRESSILTQTLNNNDAITASLLSNVFSEYSDVSIDSDDTIHFTFFYIDYTTSGFPYPNDAGIKHFKIYSNDTVSARTIIKSGLSAVYLFINNKTDKNKKTHILYKLSGNLKYNTITDAGSVGTEQELIANIRDYFEIEVNDEIKLFIVYSLVSGNSCEIGIMDDGDSAFDETYAFETGIRNGITIHNNQKFVNYYFYNTSTLNWEFVLVRSIELQITSYIPTEGKYTDAITISGNGFGATQGASTAKIGTLDIYDITTWNDTTIIGKVPNLLVGFYNVVVTVGASSATAATQFELVAVPSITSFSPVLGNYNTTITINGNNFRATQGTSNIKVGNNLVITLWSDTQIIAKVNTNCYTDFITITTAGGTNILNTFPFYTIAEINSISALSVVYGDSVNVDGYCLGNLRNTYSYFKINNLDMIYGSWQPTAIALTIAFGIKNNQKFNIRIAEKIKINVNLGESLIQAKQRYETYYGRLFDYYNGYDWDYYSYGSLPAIDFYGYYFENFELFEMTIKTPVIYSITPSVSNTQVLLTITGNNFGELLAINSGTHIGSNLVYTYGLPGRLFLNNENIDYENINDLLLETFDIYNDISIAGVSLTYYTIISWDNTEIIFMFNDIIKNYLTSDDKIILSVDTAGGRSNQVSWEYQLTGRPVITSIDDIIDFADPCVIHGLNFGTTGSIKIRYYIGDYQTRRAILKRKDIDPLAIISWTNTEVQFTIPNDILLNVNIDGGELELYNSLGMAIGRVKFLFAYLSEVKPNFGYEGTILHLNGKNILDSDKNEICQLSSVATYGDETLAVNTDLTASLFVGECIYIDGYYYGISSVTATTITILREFKTHSISGTKIYKPEMYVTIDKFPLQILYASTDYIQGEITENTTSGMITLVLNQKKLLGGYFETRPFNLDSQTMRKSSNIEVINGLTIVTEIKKIKSGDVIKITGLNIYNNVKGTPTVKVNERTLTILDFDSQSIICQIPENIVAGLISVETLGGIGYAGTLEIETIGDINHKVLSVLQDPKTGKYNRLLITTDKINVDTNTHSRTLTLSNIPDINNKQLLNETRYLVFDLNENNNKINIKKQTIPTPEHKAMTVYESNDGLIKRLLLTSDIIRQEYLEAKQNKIQVIKGSVNTAYAFNNFTDATLANYVIINDRDFTFLFGTYEFDLIKNNLKFELFYGAADTEEFTVNKDVTINIKNPAFAEVGFPDTFNGKVKSNDGSFKAYTSKKIEL
jgi:hypothetical protein